MPQSIPSTFLTAKSLLVCSECNKYLSVGPVTILNNKPLCGRCPNPMAATGRFYDVLAQHMYFPCINDQHGCDVMLAWGSATAHEEICRYTQVLCPALCCSQKLTSDKVIQHFKTFHNDLILSKRQFKVPCGRGEENGQVNKLFLWSKQAFILKINSLSSSCFCSVSSWGSFNSGNLKCKLLLEDQFKQKIFQIKDVSIDKYDVRDHNNSTMTKLEVDSLKHILETETIVCTVIIGQKTRGSNVNETLLSEVECPVCTDYLKPPVYMCAAGHSFCNSCKDNLSKCPTCRGALNNSRNVSLEKIIECIIFPCRNRIMGCRFTGTLTTLTLHEMYCSYVTETTLKCYLSHIKNCTWDGPLSHMTDHLSRMHPECHFDIGIITTIHLDNLKISLLYTEYNGQIFKVHVSRYISLDFQFGVQVVMHPTMKNSRYQYYMDFSDLNNNNRILKINGNCIVSEFDDDNLMHGNYFVIHNQLLKHFAKDNIVKVIINLVECYDCLFCKYSFLTECHVLFLILQNSSK